MVVVVVSIIQCENEILVPERIFNNHQTLGVWGRGDTSAVTPILSRSYNKKSNEKFQFS